GGGTSEVAVISLGGIVVSQSIRVGGDELDESIINYAKREHKLLICQQTAQGVQLERGPAQPTGRPRTTASKAAPPTRWRRRCRPRSAGATWSRACPRRWC